MANYQFIEQKQEEDKTIIALKIENKLFVTRKDKVFNRLTKDMKITGFRPGKAPKAMLEARLGADLYERTLNELLPEVTYEYLSDEKIDFLGRINYEVTKVSDAEGVEYKITFVKYPEIKLPNFSKIKTEEEKVTLTDEEVEVELDKIFKLKSEQSTGEDQKAKDKKTGKVTDEQVKSLGLGLSTVSELKDLLRKQLESQKKNIAVTKRIQEAIDKAIALTKIEAPKSLLALEVSRKEHDYTHRIEHLGLSLDDFLKSQSTTLEDLRKTWEEEARKQIQTDLLLFEIAKANKLKVTNEEVNAEILVITDEKLKQQYDNFEGRNYISGIILQQKAINWLSREAGIIKEESQEKK